MSYGVPPPLPDAYYKWLWMKEAALACYRGGVQFTAEGLAVEYDDLKAEAEKDD